MAGLGFFWPAAAVDCDAVGAAFAGAGDGAVCFVVTLDAFFSGGWLVVLGAFELPGFVVAAAGLSTTGFTLAFVAAR